MPKSVWTMRSPSLSSRKAATKGWSPFRGLQLTAGAGAEDLLVGEDGQATSHVDEAVANLSGEEVGVDGRVIKRSGVAQRLSVDADVEVSVEKKALHAVHLASRPAGDGRRDLCTSPLVEAFHERSESSLLAVVA